MKSSPKTIWAVIVTYLPDATRLQRVLRATLPQVDHVVIVDNGSLESPRAMLAADFAGARVELIEHGENRGLATGHNAGIDAARSGGATHVLLLDQDSEPRHGMVSHLLVALEALEATGARVGAVGPRYVDERTGHLSRFATLTGPRAAPEHASSTPVRTDFLISSGSLIPLAVVDAVGDMDDGLFIDHVDTEWCMRALSLGYSCFVVPDAMMSHELGDSSRRVWLGRWRHVANHSPTRHYYIVRNSLLLHERHYAPRAWRRRDRARLVMLAAYFALFGPDRRAHLQRMLWGWRDARAGRSGAMPTSGARGRLGSAAK
jgi:rhamnosyltransferase